MRLSWKWLWLLVALGLPLAPGGLTMPLPAIAQTVPNNARLEEADRLLELGRQQYRANQFREALQSYQAALELYQALGNRLREAISLNDLGDVNVSLGNYSVAFNYYEQSLGIAREMGDRQGEATVLSNIGSANDALGNYPEALDYYQQSLGIARDRGNRAGESAPLANIGGVHQALGNYPAALDYYQQSLATAQEMGQRTEEAMILNKMGSLHQALGSYPQALGYHQQSLVIHQELGNRAGVAQSLNSIGTVYQALGSHPQALDYYQQSLVIHREIGDRAGERSPLSNIGSVYQSLGNYPEALDYYQQSLVIAQEMEDPEGASIILNNIGSIHQSRENYPESLNYYQQSLVLTQEIGDRAGKAVTLNNIAVVLRYLNQPELAIVFLKEAVNTYETIRIDNRVLDQALQDSYTDTVVDTYRSLTDLLLDQGRILEAQQVLELLKVEELRQFTRASYASGTLTYDPVEQPVVEAHGSLIALGVTISECDPNCPQPLYDQQMALERQYDQTVASFEQTVRQRRASDRVFYDPTSLSSDALDLVNAQPGTVLIYPVVLEDRLWLLWTATGGVVGSVEVAVSQAELSRAVVRFRELLERQDAQAYDEFKVVSQQLYGWLIAPLEAELEKNRIRQLIFAQDHTTRYLPMAALYDGSQYLLERYTISTVLSAALTDTQGRLGDVASVSALGLGLTQPIPGFNALPNVAQELREAIRESNNDDRGIFPGQIFLDEAFTFDALSQNVRWANILHIATHAEFVPSTQGESYILSGTGQRLALADIGALDAQLRNLHLVILSACETALGGSALDGTEIAGVSSYFLGRNKAETVMATLWQVDDAGTSLLMQRFYALLSTGELTKAEALRQAQLSLLKGEASLDNRMDTLGIRRGFELAEPEESSVGLAHPYYWAPFILIGNGL